MRPVNHRAYQEQITSTQTDTVRIGKRWKHKSGVKKIKEMDRLQCRNLLNIIKDNTALSESSDHRTHRLRKQEKYNQN